MKSLTKLEIELYDRLNACHLAMDTSTDLMSDQGLGLEESEMHDVLAGELAETETLLKRLEIEYSL
tara:strand:- start:779 stop:976 length:198 start_codon:yes stop_codon:yes gene_type:complete